MFDSTSLFNDSARPMRLRDGSDGLIRPLSPTDRHLLVRFFDHWSPVSRRLRFLATKEKLTEEDLNFLTRADGYDHIAIVAVHLDALGEETEALGFARCVRFVQSPETAEMSVAVADDMQRQGLGSVLLDRLTGLAQSVGIRRFMCEALAENPGMRSLAMRRGGKALWHDGGTVEYAWRLPDVESAGDRLSLTGAEEDLRESA